MKPTRVAVLCAYPQRLSRQIGLAAECEKKFPESIKFSFILPAKHKRSFLGIDVREGREMFFPDLNGETESKLEIGQNLHRQDRILSSLYVLSRMQRKVLRGSGTTSLDQLISERTTIVTIKQLAGKIMGFLKACEARSLLVAGDRHVRDWLEPAALIAARQIGIKTIAPYLSYLATEKNLVACSTIPVKSNRERTLYHLLKRHYHRKTIRNGKWYFKLTTAEALRKTEVIPENPWRIGSGALGILCLPNQKEISEYIEHGIKPQKLIRIGDPVFDKLSRLLVARESVRSEVSKKYFTTEPTRVILISLPHLAEHGLLSWQQHWRFLAEIGADLRATGSSVLVSLHPKMKREMYVEWCDSFGFGCLEEPLEEAIVCADLFVAANSSTIIWAILCGIPSVSMDYFGLDYGTMRQLDSLNIAQTRQRFRELLLNTTAGTVNFRKDWETLNREENMDGNVVARYVSLFIHQTF